MKLQWNARLPLTVFASFPLLFHSGTSMGDSPEIQLAQVGTISRESDDALEDPDGPSQIDLLEEADEREGIRFDVKASEIRDWRSKVRAAYPTPEPDVEAGPGLSGSPSIRRLCGKNIERPDLIQREQQLAETQAMLMEEMARVQAIQEQVREKWSQVSMALAAAQTLQISAELNCEGWGTDVFGSEVFAGQDPTDPANAAQLAAREERVQQVVMIMKSMKPKPAAQILQGWDPELAVMALLRLPPRVGSKIVAELPPEVAGRLTTLLAPPEKDGGDPGSD